MDTPNNEINTSAASENKDDSQKKKKNIIRIYHAQNASDTGRGRGNADSQRSRRQRPAAAAKPAAEAEKKAPAEDAAAAPAPKAAPAAEEKKETAAAAAKKTAAVTEKKPAASETEKKASPAETEKKAAAPETEKKAAASEIEKKAAAPEIEKKAAAPEIEKKVAAPEIEKKVAAPEMEKKAAAHEIEKKAAAHEIEKKAVAHEIEKKPAASEAEKKPAPAETEKKAAAAEKKAAAPETEKKPAPAETEKKPAAAEKKPAAAEPEKKAAPAEEVKPSAAPEGEKKASEAKGAPRRDDRRPQGDRRENKPAAGGRDDRAGRPYDARAQRTDGAAGRRDGSTRTDGRTGTRSDGSQGNRAGVRSDGSQQGRQGRTDGGERRGDMGGRRDGQGQGRPASQTRPPRDGAGMSARPYGDGTGAQRGTGRPGGSTGSPRFGQGGRPTGGQGSFGGDGAGRSFGQGQGRPSGQGRGGQGGRRQDAGAAFAPEMSKNQKDSKRERDRENKNKNNRKDYDQAPANQGKRPGQGGVKGGPKTTVKPVTAPKIEEKKPEVKEITLPEKLTIRELAEAMKVQPSVIVKKLFLQGVMVTVNQEIDFEKAQEIALEYDIIAEKEEKVNVIEELLKEADEDEATMVSRPPVVCVMGHVDHGKTSLLDAIRNTNVTRGEAGGITQHIGAYVVEINGQKITFLDTPGHEAFTAMRMRGANATDIAVLVVAADDGVMPQTIEAISHAKAAGVTIIVAINKIDKPGANIDRVKQGLAEQGLVPEDWGGDTVFAEVSAKTGEGIDNLLEMILLTAEMAELKANPNRDARGLVIEAELDKGKGPVATILVQKGTLHVGDFIAAGACSGKVRAMMDDKGRRVKEAGPSTPVEILGLNDVPNAGEVLMAFDSDKEAKNFAGAFVSENKNRLLEETKGKLSLDNLFDQMHVNDLKELPIIVKADVQGSVEAVRQSLVKLSNDEVIVKVIHGGVGAINESDVSLAATSNAIIIGFNVRPDATAKSLAEQEKVDMRLYKVIYQAIEDVENAMKGMLDPIFEEKIIGHAEIRQIFKASGIGNIAGSYVLDGVFQRNCKVRITREGDKIFEGDLASLKRFKDDVKEVRAGYECGLVFDGFNDIKEEDKVEAYIMVEVPR